MCPLSLNNCKATLRFTSLTPSIIVNENNFPLIFLLSLFDPYSNKFYLLKQQFHLSHEGLVDRLRSLVVLLL